MILFSFPLHFYLVCFVFIFLIDFTFKLWLLPLAIKKENTPKNHTTEEIINKKGRKIIIDYSSKNLVDWSKFDQWKIFG